MECYSFGINTQQFPELTRLEPRKGETRAEFFNRQFGNKLSAIEHREVIRFINQYGHQPMLPDWPKRGCYGISAFKHFMKHSNRDALVSAILIADLLYAYPETEQRLVMEMALSDQISRLRKFAEDQHLDLALQFLDSKRA